MNGKIKRVKFSHRVQHCYVIYWLDVLSIKIPTSVLENFRNLVQMAVTMTKTKVKKIVILIWKDFLCWKNQMAMKKNLAVEKTSKIDSHTRSTEV